MGIRVLAAAAILAVAVAGDAGQSQGGGRLRVDFRAVAADGSPVAGLAPDDVAIRLGGQPRPVTSLEFFESARLRATTASIPPPYVSTGDPGPAADVYLIADSRVDVDRVRPAIEALLDALAPSDRVGFFRLRPGGPSLLPTHAHEALRGAVAALAPIPEAECAAGQASDALTTIVRARVDPAPAVFVVFTAAGPGEEVGQCGLRAADAARIADVVRGKPIQIFFVQAGDPPPTLDALARATGGRAIRLDADPTAAMTRLARETSAFYTATIELLPGDRDGSVQALQIGTARPGTTIAARGSLTMPAGGRPVPALQPREMVRSGVPYAGVPIRAAAYPSSNYDGRVKVVVLLEAADGEASLSAASFALFDRSGRLVSQASASTEDLQRRPAVAALVAAPDRYRLRIAATDGRRRGGTLEFDVDARLRPAGPLTLSGLILGGPDVLAFEPRLAFTSEEAATAYVELYGVPAGATVAVRFELARTPEGPALASMPAMLPPSSTPGRIATAALPIAGLPPGDFVVRAHVALDGAARGSTHATLRKR